MLTAWPAAEFPPKTNQAHKKAGLIVDVSFCRAAAYPIGYASTSEKTKNANWTGWLIENKGQVESDRHRTGLLIENKGLTLELRRSLDVNETKGSYGLALGPHPAHFHRSG